MATPTYVLSGQNPEDAYGNALAPDAGASASSASEPRSRRTVVVLQADDLALIEDLALLEAHAGPPPYTPVYSTAWKAARSGFLCDLTWHVDTHGLRDDKAPNGLTALMWASQFGRDDCVAFLVAQSGYNLNSKCPAGLTALMYAARGGFDACLNILLDGALDGEGRGATLRTAALRARSDARWTALCWAAYAGQHRCISLLLARGATFMTKCRTSPKIDVLLGDCA